MEGSERLTSDHARELLRVICLREGKPKSIAEILYYADAVERSPITRRDLESGLGLLYVSGLIEPVGRKWAPTEKGRSIPNSYEERTDLILDTTPTVVPISSSNFLASKLFVLAWVLSLPLLILALLVCGFIWWRTLT